MGFARAVWALAPLVPVLFGCDGGRAPQLANDQAGDRVESSARGGSSSATTGASATTGGAPGSGGRSSAQSSTTTGGPSTSSPSSTGGAGGSTPSAGMDAAPPLTPSGVDSFDPGDVYLLGTLTGVRLCSAAIVSVTNPVEYTIGFPGCDLAKPVLGGQELFYRNGGVYAFDADLAPEGFYPANPERNDDEMWTPSCDPSAVLASPDGDAIFRCPNAIWYRLSRDFNAAIAYDAWDLISYGPQGIVLDRGFVLRRSPDVDVGGVTGLPSNAVPRRDALGWRAHSDGFLVVLSLDGAEELWDVDVEGRADHVATYAAIPGEVSQMGSSNALDPDGVFYQTVDLRDGNGVIRRSPEGDSEVVYRDADEVVKVGTSGELFSGQ